MSYNGSGTYVPPAGQPVATGTVIQSATFNTLVTDIGNTFNNVLPRDGQAPMQGQLKLIDGTSSVPSIAFNSDASTGIFRPTSGNLALTVSGVETLRINSAGRVLVGTTVDDGANKLQINGPVKIAGALTITGALTAALFSGPLTGNVTGNVSGTAANVTGTVAVTNGGTGATTAPAALINLGAAPIANPTFTGTVGGITAAMVGFTQTGTGAVARTVQAKLGEAISVQDFGAVGDGVTDNTAAFTAFLTYLKTHGGKGIVPAGTYNISYIDIDLSGNLPFEVIGDGIGKTVLHCTAPTYNFLTFSNCSKVAVRRLTIDNGFQVGQSQSNGGSLIYVNANDCVTEEVAAINVVRVAFMSYNDHQTTLSNVYSGMVYNRCYVDGGAAFIDGQYPSAYIIADANNSRIENGYIKNIGLYGYEFKNDCSNCLIANCIAEDAFNAVYFGGDGAHTELGYVKRSKVENIIINRSSNPLFIGQASYNTFNNITIDNTGHTGQIYTVGMRNNSNYNEFRGIVSINRGAARLFDFRTTANNNILEFSNIADGGTNTIAGLFDNTCSSNQVIFGNRDGAYTLIPSVVYNNTVIDKYANSEVLNTSFSALKKIKLGDVGTDSLFSTSKGLAVLGDTADLFMQTKQDFHYKYVGNFTKPDIFIDRYQLSIGERRWYETVSGTTTFTSLDTTAFFPGADGGKALGKSGFRWGSGHIQKLYLYPASSDVPTVNGQLSVEATSNTQLTFRFKGSDGTIRSATLTLA